MGAVWFSICTVGWIFSFLVELESQTPPRRPCLGLSHMHSSQRIPTAVPDIASYRAARRIGEAAHAAWVTSLVSAAGRRQLQIQTSNGSCRALCVFVCESWNVQRKIYQVLSCAKFISINRCGELHFRSVFVLRKRFKLLCDPSNTLDHCTSCNGSTRHLLFVSACAGVCILYKLKLSYLLLKSKCI